MQLKPKRLMVLFTAFFFLSLTLSNTISAPALASQETQELQEIQETALHYYDLTRETIGILCDESADFVTGTAHSLEESLSLMTADVKTLQMRGLQDLDDSLIWGGVSIAVYVFQSDYEAMFINGIAVEWEKIASMVQKQPNIIHIFATGNTHQLLSLLSEGVRNVYGSGEEILDAQHAFLYALWMLADVLENSPEARANNLGRDVRYATLKYFAGNFNELIARNIEPQDVLGKEAPETIENRRARFYAKHPDDVKRVVTEGYVLDPVTGREVDAVTGEVRSDYLIDIIPVQSLTSSDFPLFDVPLESGLRGPMGGIVDGLLGILLNTLGGVFGLSQSTVNNIVSVLGMIDDLVGVVKDPSASKIKAFIDELKPMLPISEDMMKYVDVLIDALFLLRGDFNDIKNVILSVIELLLPDTKIGGFNLRDLLSGVFDLTSGIVDKIQEGGSVMDIILSVLNENILANLTSTFLGNITSSLGATATQISQMSTKIVSTGKMIINFFSSFSLENLIRDYAPMLLKTAFSELGLDDRVINMTTKALGLLLSGTGLMDLNYAELLQSLLQDIIPGTVTDPVTKAKRMAESLVANISNAISGDVTPSVNDFRTFILNTLNSVDLGLSTETKQAIQDIATLLVALSNQGFSIVGVVDTGEMIGNILSGLGFTSGDTIEAVKTVINTIMGVIAYIKDMPSLKTIMGNFLSSLPSPKELIKKLTTFIVSSVMGIDESAISETAKKVIDTASQGIGLIMNVIGTIKDNPVEGILMTILEGSTYVISQLTNVDMGAFVGLAEGLLGQFLKLNVESPSVDEIITTIAAFMPADILDSVKTIVELLNNVKSIFTDGFKFIFSQLTSWLAGQITELINSLSGSLGGIMSGEGANFDINLNIGLAGFSLFNLKIGLNIGLGFAIDGEKLGEMIFDLVFKGLNIFGGSGASLATGISGSDQGILGIVNATGETGVAGVGDILKKAFSFISINPIFGANIELSDFGSETGFFNFLLEAMGLQLSFSGYGFFKMEIFSFKNGVFNWDNFFKVLEWGFGFAIQLSKTLTLLDFLTGGAGGSLNAVGKYIGLDAISITIMFKIALDIVKRAASGNQPETGSLTLAISIGVTVTLGIDIIIASLKFTGTLIVTLTFLQDLVVPSPMQVFLGIELIITVTIGFLFWDWDFDFHWSPFPNNKKELTSSSESAKEDGAMGVDEDGDGLQDEYEKSTPGLNFQAADSDGDGLGDKMETQVLKSDPSAIDSDGDGMDDSAEYAAKTSLLAVDSDFDQVSDYDEVVVYGTNPLSLDTDEDGLTDHYEIFHEWNISGVTPSVSHIKIGDSYFDDRTDPLNPDTDGDGLLDGQEGERGIYYGINKTINTSEVDSGMEDPPLVFNGGYTHPLDNDTDDDSYEQTYDGAISPRRRWLRDMSDLTEINGLWIVFIDTETGEPLEPRLVRTNPTNPDSDGDTGVTADQRINPPFGFFLLGDGYELATTPPTDPLDGDTDDDGLIDGLEGMLRPDSNHTSRTNPDTDGDGLGDREELLVGTNARSLDTDLDGISDGDEFFIFGTNPFMNDTDYDGLLDGEEVWYYHSNPFIRDSDVDGLKDYDEVWVYMTDPMDEDSDNDFLTDFEEIFIYYTDPFESDTDSDGLFDGEEVKGYDFYDPKTNTTTTLFTDPTRWDTDNDSLTTIDQFGKMSMPMSDGDEFLIHKTNPTIRDTDMDGIQDGWELWLGKGVIPEDSLAEPLDLDPLNNDTDGDGLLDGQECYVDNRTTLLNPYIGFFLTFPYNTSPINPDTDEDLLTDREEIREHFTNPSNTDTDNDTLGDYEELYLHFSSPHKNDTDGDGLVDWQEVGPNRTYMTDVRNSDTDGDLLPDGAEVLRYGSDPLNPDQNSNDLLDGMEIDSDGDYLMDGEEYYVYRTIEVLGGGPFQPDSDHDGLFDGQEVYEVGTSPVLWDTDNDTFSDGLEYYIGTDPLNDTSLEDMIAALEGSLDALILLSPANTTYKYTSIPVIVYNPSESVESMEYRYRDINASWFPTTYTMDQNITSPMYWSGPDLELPVKPNATYELQVTGAKSDDSTLNTSVVFSVELAPNKLSIVSPINMTYRVNVLPIEVSAGSNITSVKYSILYPNGTWTGNKTLPSIGLGRFYLANYTFLDDSGLNSYTMQVFGDTLNSTVMSQVSFSIDLPSPDFTPIILVGGTTITLVGGGYLLFTGKLKLPFRRGGGGGGG